MSVVEEARLSLPNRRQIVGRRSEPHRTAVRHIKKPLVLAQSAVAHERRAGFRFRYRKVWGFKSLLVHYSETLNKSETPRTVDAEPIGHFMPPSETYQSSLQGLWSKLSLLSESKLRAHSTIYSTKMSGTPASSRNLLSPASLTERMTVCGSM
jgi:hypothetical protein